MGADPGRLSRWPCQNRRPRPSYGRTGQSHTTLSRADLIFRHAVARDAGTRRRATIAILAGLSGLAAYAVFNEAAQGSALDARVRALSAENAALQQQIDQRTTQIGEAGNVDWLEGQARRLGFVFPGETLYIITSPGTALPPTGGINATLPTFAPPTPTPSASTAPSASPGASSSPTPSAAASPTPLVFVMPTPTPTPH